MESARNLFGLSAQAKARLIERLSSASGMRTPRAPPSPQAELSGRATGRLDLAEFEAYREIRMIREAAEFLDIADPFFRVHEGIAGAETQIGDRTYINFASYNYLGLNGHPRDRRGGKIRDRPLRHLGLGQPPGLGRAADPPGAGAGARARSTAPKTAWSWSAGIRPMSRSSGICSAATM